MGDELVSCHAGYAYPERPTALRWEGQRLEIAVVLRQARTPAGWEFRVRVADGREFMLIYCELQDDWQVNPI